MNWCNRCAQDNHREYSSMNRYFGFCECEEE